MKIKDNEEFMKNTRKIKLKRKLNFERIIKKFQP